MKREPINLNQVNSMNLDTVVNQLQNQLPQGAVLLDKNLLPSRGKFYPGDIYIKKLTTLNIKNLATLDEKNITGIINGVLQSCVFGINTEKILVGDKVWLIFYLRSFTYDDLAFKLRGECEACQTIANYDYHIKDLDVIYFDKELPEEFEIGNDKISIRFPTIATETQATKLKTNDQIIEDIISDLLDFSTYIDKINGKDVSMLTAYKYVCEMDAMAYSQLVNILTEYIFTAKPYARFKCKTCGEELTLPISFVPEFFLPKI